MKLLFFTCLQYYIIGSEFVWWSEEGKHIEKGKQIEESKQIDFSVEI